MTPLPHPAIAILIKAQATDPLVQQDQLAVDRPRSPRSGGRDLLHHRGRQLPVGRLYQVHQIAGYRSQLIEVEPQRRGEEA